MKRILISTGVVMAIVASAIFAFGDIARPKPSPAEAKSIYYGPLRIVTDPKGSEARLQISETEWKRMTEAGATIGENLSMGQRIMHSSTRTVIAGLFMFLAVSFAGVWFARSGQRRDHKAIATVLLLAVVFGVATVIVRANAGPSPPGYLNWQKLPQSLKDGKETRGGVEVEVVPGNEGIKLIIPLRNKNQNGEE
jgi:hypothetical protein